MFLRNKKCKQCKKTFKMWRLNKLIIKKICKKCYYDNRKKIIYDRKNRKVNKRLRKKYNYLNGIIKLVIVLEDYKLIRNQKSVCKMHKIGRKTLIKYNNILKIKQ